jgi:hypothetical protein
MGKLKKQTRRNINFTSYKIYHIQPKVIAKTRDEILISITTGDTEVILFTYGRFFF